MRLKIFISSISALLFGIFTQQASACAIYEYNPAEYLLFRVYDPDQKSGGKREIEQLQPSDDPQVMEYLRIARQCEELRKKYNSPWYYPMKNDPVLTGLEEVIAKAMAYKGSELKDRYMLQAARAMFSLGKFEQMCRWWSEIESEVGDGAIRDHILGYVAGAKYRTGDVENALKYFGKIGDDASVMYCLNQEGRFNGFISIQKYCPDSPKVFEILQEEIRQLELYFYDDPETLTEYFNVCMSIARSSANPGPWLYSAAYLKYLSGEVYVARNILHRAEKCKSSEFMKDSIKVLRILLESSVSIYNKEYETKLLEDLKWLDEKIVSNLTEEEKERTALNPYLLKANFSYYYWNDMMRKIVLGTVVPRMQEAGKTPLALLLSNYASNRMISLVDRHHVDIYDWDKPAAYMTLAEYRNNSELYNYYDYSSPYFLMLSEDDISISLILEYAGRLSSPKSALEIFLAERSYIDDDYLNDVIGTRYLRLCRYKDALVYLAKVQSSYQARLNTSIYMKRMPFHYDRGRASDIIPDYKLSFAKQMIECEEIIAGSSDPDVVGHAKIKYGIGMRNSMDFCWALTHYAKSVGFPLSKYADKYAEEGRRTIASGLRQQTNENHCDVLANYY